MDEENITATFDEVDGDTVPVYEYTGDYSEFDSDSPDEETITSEIEETLTYQDQIIELQIQQNYLLITIAFGIFLLAGIVLARVIWRKF